MVIHLFASSIISSKALALSFLGSIGKDALLLFNRSNVSDASFIIISEYSSGPKTRIISPFYLIEYELIKIIFTIIGELGFGLVRINGRELS